MGSYIEGGEKYICLYIVVQTKKKKNTWHKKLLVQYNLEPSILLLFSMFNLYTNIYR